MVETNKYKIIPRSERGKVEGPASFLYIQKITNIITTNDYKQSDWFYMLFR